MELEYSSYPEPERDDTERNVNRRGRYLAFGIVEKRPHRHFMVVTRREAQTAQALGGGMSNDT